VRESAWIAKYTVVGGYLARLFSFTDRCDDIDTFVVWRHEAVVVPEGDITALVVLLTSVTCFQDVNVSGSFLACGFGVLSFAGQGRMEGFQWAKVGVAFL